MALLLAALAAGAAYVMQPIGGWPGVAPVDGADPTRLEAHVRMLAETLAPRSWKRTDNLDRAAAYVAAELRRAGARVSEQAYRVDGAGQAAGLGKAIGRFLQRFGACPNKRPQDALTRLAGRVTPMPTRYGTRLGDTVMARRNT